MSFLTAQDFNVIPYSIPNVAQNSSFEEFVAACEEDLLRRVLGSGLYKDFTEGLVVDPVAAKWTDLKNGADFELYGKTYRWRGMKHLLRPAIYAKWLIHNSDTHTESGVIISDVTNGRIVSPGQRVSAAWGDFLFNLVNCEADEYDNLYAFLEVKLSDYPNWDFRHPGYINSFGL